MINITIISMKKMTSTVYVFFPFFFTIISYAHFYFDSEMTHHSPIMHRGTIRFRNNLSRQSSIELDGPVTEIVYENEDGETANGNGKTIFDLKDTCFLIV